MTLATGVALGRFQPVHNDHFEYLDAVRVSSSLVVIGITNPDRSAPKDQIDAARTDLVNNPFSYYERAEMLGLALLERGWTRDEWRIVPAPIEEQTRLREFLPDVETSTIFVTIYDDWGRKKRDSMRQLGFQVEVVYERPGEEKGITSTEVRNRIRTGQEWHHLVPSSVGQYIEQLGRRV